MLDLHPLSLDRELKDLVFFCNCLYCSTDSDVLNYESFVSHGRTRQIDSSNLRTPLCKTSNFQASYSNRIVKLWNYVCKLAPPTSFCSLNAFQLFIHKLISAHLSRVYDLNSLARGHLPKHAHATLDINCFILMNACVYFCFNFRS